RAERADKAGDRTPTASNGGTQRRGPESNPDGQERPAASLATPVAGEPVSKERRQAPRSAPLRSNQLVTNRDWMIPIECTADALVLPLTGQRIAITALPRGEGKRNPLSAAVHQLTARRQAGVRPGEPPYRPQIRFRVQPDGLRSYYLAYPALEGLRVPMSR